MPDVIIRRCDYEYSALRPVVFDILDRTIGGRTRPGDRALIKPNFLAPAPPESGIITHPFLLRAAAEYMIEQGARVQVSDSPAMGSFEKILKTGGYEEELKGLDIRLSPFSESVFADVGKPFGEIEIARDALEADIVINLPKLKTHTQMLLTLGVKNLFGCIVGMRKPEWHFRAGVDRDMFARLLVRVHNAVGPAVTILDGVLSLEGQGPGKGGHPRKTGIIVGSTDATALDETVARMVGVRPEDVPTISAAREIGLPEGEINIIGEIPWFDDFELPELTPLVFGPKATSGFMRRHLVQRPVCDSSLCRHCGECWRYCPAKAISHTKKKLVFDYDKCIRCYCCVEVCPYGALSAKESIAGRLIRKALRLKS